MLILSKFASTCLTKGCSTTLFTNWADDATACKVRSNSEGNISRSFNKYTKFMIWHFKLCQLWFIGIDLQITCNINKFSIAPTSIILNFTQSYPKMCTEFHGRSATNWFYEWGIDCNKHMAGIEF